MLRRASLQAVQSGSLLRRSGENHLVVAMQVYPRFLPKNKIDEYQRSLAPERGLFSEYRELCVRHGKHETAFQLVNYEERFDLGVEGREQLQRLTKLAEEGCEVHLICRCSRDQHCHVDLVLLMAHHLFQAPIPDLPFAYERFQDRFRLP
jgi:hypothetical protein